MSKLDELYERLGVRKGISAAGSTTMYGGSKLRSEVKLTYSRLYNTQYGCAERSVLAQP